MLPRMEKAESSLRDSDDDVGLRFRRPVGPLDRNESTFSSTPAQSDDIRDRYSRSDTPITVIQRESSNARFTRPLSVLDFFLSEITRGYALENDEGRYSEKRKKVYEFVKVPRELERFLFYGFLQCTDAFLYIFTLLPVRFFLGIWHLFTRLFGQAKIRDGKQANGSRILAPSEICDLLKIFIIITSSILMTFIDTSWMYHVVRGQAVIKLYIFYNMLEVGDKLFSSFGQDVLDALFWTATRPHGRSADQKGTGRSGSRSHLDQFGMGTLPHLFLAIVYVSSHTLLVLFQATTLNVAFNSHNKALLTIMLSNNFVELKGSVFKKFAKNNLFQMACSDVRERFHILILLAVVVVRNMTAVNWRAEHFWEMVPDLAMVGFGEFLVDWLKHAFITKFNEIPHEVYKDFTITIAYDVARSRQKTAFSDHSDQVSRRMGFIPLPLGVLMIRILGQSFARPLTRWYSPSMILIFSIIFVALLTLKLLNSIILLGEACKHIETYEQMQKQADLLRPFRKRKAKSVPASPKLSLIEFNDVMQQSHQPVKGFTVSDVLQQAAEELANFAGETPQPSPGPTDTALKPHRRSKSVVQFGSPRSRHPSETNAAAVSPGDKSAPGGVPVADESIGTGDVGVSPTKANRSAMSECESLQAVDRYTLCNDDRIVS